jgi:membrane associated rhomboid family serine protease
MVQANQPDQTTSPLNTDPDITAGEQEWMRVAKYPDVKGAHEHALVILAMGLPCWIEIQPGSSDHHLLVGSASFERVRQELEQYDLENHNKPALRSTDAGSFSHRPGWIAYLSWVIVLLVVHRMQLTHPEMAELGASSSIGLIEHGQWWRPFTALFLHADFVHLIGNLLSGLFFATLVSSSIGPWRAWLLILGCGTIGNLATSALEWPDPYRAIGASTAVFAALGILSGLGLAWMLRFRKQLQWTRVIAPLLGGIVVLGMTGSASPDSNTDVLGHILGFAAGVIAGGLVGSLSGRFSYKVNSGTSKAESGART